MKYYRACVFIYQKYKRGKGIMLDCDDTTILNVYNWLVFELEKEGK